jgi:hypothetical protein
LARTGVPSMNLLQKQIARAESNPAMAEIARKHPGRSYPVMWMDRI